MTRDVKKLIDLSHSVAHTHLKASLGVLPKVKWFLKELLAMRMWRERKGRETQRSKCQQCHSLKKGIKMLTSLGRMAACRRVPSHRQQPSVLVRD